MATKTFLAAGVLSLILVGAPGKTQAESTTKRSDSSSEVVKFMGKTLCFPKAHPLAKCDWRLPMLGSHPSSMQASNATEAALGPKVFRLLGETFCVGSVPISTRCSVKLPGTKAPGERHARL